MKRVVVTGLGLVTPLASNVDSSWKKLINSESGIGKIHGFETEDLPVKIAGHVPGNESEDGFDPNINKILIMVDAEPNASVQETVKQMQKIFE